MLAAAPNNSQANVNVQGPTLILNTWSNVIFTYDGSSLKLYVNGVLLNSTSTSLLLNTAGNSGISIGESNQANGYWHPSDAKIDDIGIWNRALDSTEIQQLYTGTSLQDTCAYYDTTYVTVYDTIAVYDTITHYDTVLVSVTDTLIINVELTGVAPPNNTNTL